jgi:hypothetical protein
MKRTVLLAALLLVPAASFAVSPPEKLRAPVVVPAMGFAAKVADGRVIASWKRYKRDDFYAYELLKSDKADPAYAPRKSLYATHNVGDLGFEDGRLAVGTWHYRLVIVTSFGDLWVSPVVTVTVGPGDLKREPPTVADFE